MTGVINRFDLQSRLGVVEFRVGNSTTVTDNPTCDVDITDGGFYECDLWGSYVFISRKVSFNEYLNLGEITIWGDKNIAPLGTASMQTTSGSQTADKASTPAPIDSDYDRIDKYSLSLTNGGNDPWWQLDFGRDGIPIKYVLTTPR